MALSLMIFLTLGISHCLGAPANTFLTNLQVLCTNSTHLLKNQKEVFESCTSYEEINKTTIFTDLNLPNVRCLLYLKSITPYCQKHNINPNYPTASELSNKSDVPPICGNLIHYFNIIFPNNTINKNGCLHLCTDMGGNLAPECIYANYYNMQNQILDGNAKSTQLASEKMSTELENTDKDGAPTNNNIAPANSDSELKDKNNSEKANKPSESAVLIEKQNNKLSSSLETGEPANTNNSPGQLNRPSTHEVHGESKSNVGGNVEKTETHKNEQNVDTSANNDPSVNIGSSANNDPSVNIGSSANNDPSVNIGSSANNDQTLNTNPLENHDQQSPQSQQQPDEKQEQKPHPSSSKQDLSEKHVDTNLSKTNPEGEPKSNIQEQIEADIEDNDNHGLPNNEDDDGSEYGDGANTNVDAADTQPKDQAVVDGAVDKTVEKKPDIVQDNPVSNESMNDIDGESYFFSYFMVICVLFVLGYVGYHNRIKVMALLLEGKRGKRQQRGRRPNSANYHKLDSNLEEAISSNVTKNSNNVIY